MECNYCGHVHTKIIEVREWNIFWIACGNCERFIIDAPSHIPKQQKRKYLEKLNDKYGRPPTTL
jgi:hypothetical protein